MLLSIEKVERTICAINIVLTKNGHLLSVEDIDLLKKCILKLEELKKELTEAEATLLNVVQLLDDFFGPDESIQQYFNS